MVFQQPNPLPNHLQRKTLAFRCPHSHASRANMDELVRVRCARPFIWDETKDKLKEHGGQHPLPAAQPATALTIARADCDRTGGDSDG